MSARHRLLRRQIASFLGSESEGSEALRRFLDAVDDAYHQSDADRKLLERSLDLSSQELLQANSEMRAVIQAFPDVFLWLASDGTILGCRGQDSADLLLPAHALVGKRIQDVPDQDVATKFGRALEQVTSGTPLVTVEYSLQRPGEHRYYEARLVSLSERQILAIIRNITDRRTAETSLERSISVLQATLEATTDGILVVESSGKVSAFNQKFADLWRIPPAVLKTAADDRLLAFVRDQLVEPEEYLAKVREVYHRPDAESVDEVRFKDGRIFERYSRPQRIGGSSVGRVWSFRDITDRRRDEQTLRERDEQLLQAQKMEAVGLLAGGIAHDFNNILTAIIGYSCLLLDQIDSAHPFRSDIEEIHKSGESAASLTRQLLAFSRGQILMPQILDLNAVISPIDTLLRRLIGEDIELVSRLGSDLHRVNVDPGQIEQIIVNLAVNARDAMPKGGRLTTETANAELDEASLASHEGVPPGRFVVLTMSDTGVGIPEESRPHIFEPFFTTKMRGKGTGLGLATVYGIVKQSGGVIHVHSELGLGTTFKVFFPAVAVQREEPTRTAAPKAMTGAETILIAEDQPEVRSVTCAVLTRNGYTVLAADGGAQALQIARDYPEPIDLLLTDVVMPVMSGPDLAARLHEILPGVRVLYASGYIDYSVVQHGILEPGVAFLQKPFTPEGLLAKVREVLAGPADSASREIA